MRRYSVIVDKCIRDLLCVAACMRGAIHPTPDEPAFATAGQLFINPRRCIGCGACLSACESEAIFENDDLPASLQHFAEINAAYYVRGELGNLVAGSGE